MVTISYSLLISVLKILSHIFDIHRLSLSHDVNIWSYDKQGHSSDSHKWHNQTVHNYYFIQFVLAAQSCQSVSCAASNYINMTLDSWVSDSFPAHNRIWTQPPAEGFVPFAWGILCLCPKSTQTHTFSGRNSISCSGDFFRSVLSKVG